MPKKKTKVLVAEDDQFLLKVYLNKFKMEDYDVISALDGVEAMKKLKSEKPDILLLDLVMPEKDGFEVLCEMKMDPELKKIPVVILSNLGQESDIKKGKELGADDYMVKANFSINEVVDKVKEVLARSKRKK